MDTDRERERENSNVSVAFHFEKKTKKNSTLQRAAPRPHSAWLATLPNRAQNPAAGATRPSGWRKDKTSADF